MNATTQLLTQIIDIARSKGLKQKDLAQRAGISAESLSRAKKAGDMHLSNLEKLAAIVGLQLCLNPAESLINKINSASMFR